jgi:hypothetical protein
MAESNFDAVNALTIRGRAVRFDENGLARLNDIWAAAQSPKNRRPHDWQRLNNPKIEHVLKLITGKSRNYDKADMHRVYITRIGKSGGIYADVRLALDYAEANDWAARRALGRSVRHSYTDQLKDRGVKGGEYGQCTNETYVGLFNRTALQLKGDKGLGKNGKLRDAMTTAELVKVAFSEVLSVERMETEDSQGFPQCRIATRYAAHNVKAALEANKRDSQPSLNY